MCCPSNTRKHPEPPCPPQGLLLSLEQSCSSHHPWPWPKGKQALMTVLTMRRVWCWTGVVCGPNIFNRPLILGFLFVCLAFGMGGSSAIPFLFSSFHSFVILLIFLNTWLLLSVHMAFCLFGFVLAKPCGLWDLVAWPGSKPAPPALEAQSLNYGTFRKVLSKHTFNEHLLWEDA